MKPKVVEVEWKDSWYNGSDKFTKDELATRPDFILFAAGYLVHRDKRGINLASEYRDDEGDKDNVFRHVQHIPASLILKVREFGRKARK